MHALFRMHAGRFSDYWLPILHDVWAHQACAELTGGEILHVMLHGTSLPLIKKAKSRGMLVIGEAVNAHPEVYHAVNFAEHRRLGFDYPPRFNKQMMRLLLELEVCDYILCPSRWVAESFIKRGVAPARIKIIPYGVNLRTFSSCVPQETQRSSAGGQFIVSCACQIIPRKGVHHLLAAWRNLASKFSNAQLWLIGRLPSEYASIIDDLPANVLYKGAMDRSAVAGYLRNSNVFVLPTCEDGFAVATLEAMATGCAVITTDSNGASEVIENWHDGVVVPSGVPDALATVLEKLYSDRGLCSEIGARGSIKATSLYSWEQYAVELTSFYEEIANAR